MNPTQTIPRHSDNNLKGQRGAALVSTLLISAMLLTAGGMLILTTSMAGTNTIDAAAEMQAYYGAEAGIQAGLNVLRGNVMPNPLFAANPPGDVAPENEIDFRKAVTRATSNLAGDPVTAGFPSRLSRWLAYNYTPPSGAYADRVAISPGYNPFNGIAYNLAVTDPDNTPVSRRPSRLIIQATGYGPRGARKTLSMLVVSNGLDLTVPATLTLRGHDDGVTDAVLDLGNSNSKTYSGIDNSGVEATRPTIAISNHDVDITEAAYAAKPNTVEDPKYMVLDLPGEAAPAGLEVEPPWFLETADAARLFLAQAEVLALKKGRVVTSLVGAAGTTAAPEFIFVKGDCNLDSGAGLLIVTGTLTTSGNPSFSGIILVLGEGRIIKSGGGNGNTFGATTVARFGATGGFLEPTFQVSGGGTSNLQYDSTSFNDAAAIAGPKVLGVVEQ